MNILTKFHKDWMKTETSTVYTNKLLTDGRTHTHIRMLDITRSHKPTMSLRDSGSRFIVNCPPENCPLILKGAERCPPIKSLWAENCPPIKSLGAENFPPVRIKQAEICPLTIINWAERCPPVSTSINMKSRNL
ncbi:hypothetical protein DPMN_089541 [Dreissena polymorpha]|uniref:Uncharacterized protein n=1 Tax=Dreissena polymorpha TaxID=45954 RepID=A0A9D4KW56_DREPO|nr:hypothetical protein DPMN_089541 [Dreissena polymorpha]